MIETTTKTHLAHGIEKTEYLVQYDDSVKELLSDKQVLAWIAKYRIEEFKNYDIPTIMNRYVGNIIFRKTGCQYKEGTFATKTSNGDDERFGRRNSYNV